MGVRLCGGDQRAMKTDEVCDRYLGTFGRRYFWGYLRLIMSISWINTRKFYESVANSIARKGVQRVNDPLAGSRGSAPWVLPNKHAEAVCSRHQLNRAKGSREELPCGVKGQRPLGFPNKHAEAVCSRHQLNRAKGSRDETPCGVKGQRPLGLPLSITKRQPY